MGYLEECFTLQHRFCSALVSQGGVLSCYSNSDHQCYKGEVASSVETDGFWSLIGLKHSAKMPAGWQASTIDNVRILATKVPSLPAASSRMFMKLWKGEKKPRMIIAIEGNHRMPSSAP